MRVDELRAELDRAAGPEPAPSDAFVTTFLRRQATLRARRRWGVAGLALVLSFAVVVSVLALRPGPSERSVESPAGPASTTVVRTDVAVARVELHSPVITAGTMVPATVVVENHTGSPITISACDPTFQPVLGNARYQQTFPLATTACTQTSTIPLGTSRYPISIDVSYSECVPVPGGADGEVPCNLSGAPDANLMPPLPEGVYQLTIEPPAGGQVQPPPPTDVQVATERCATSGRSVKVPDVRGEAAGAAVGELGRQGFIVIPELAAVDAGRKARHGVVEQVPSPGISAPRYSCVVIRTR